MYMYLSHRIRRMFLSEACPQNLSPRKPLSLKDLRFLQKKRVERFLTRTVVKQKKVLYEKHIGFLLQDKGFERVMARVENIRSAYKAIYTVPLFTPQFITPAKKRQQEQQLLFPADPAITKRDYQKTLQTHDVGSEGMLENSKTQQSASSPSNFFAKKMDTYDAPKRTRTIQVVTQQDQGTKRNIDHNYWRNVPLQPASTFSFPDNVEKETWEKTPIYVSGPCKKNKVTRLLVDKWFESKKTEKYPKISNSFGTTGHRLHLQRSKGVLEKIKTTRLMENRYDKPKKYAEVHKRQIEASLEQYKTINRPPGKADFILNSHHYNMYRKPLTLFVQSIKVQSNPLFNLRKQTPSFFPPENVVAKNSRISRKTAAPAMNNLVHNSRPLTLFTKKKPVPMGHQVPPSFSKPSFIRTFAVATSYRGQLLRRENSLILEKRTFSDIRYKEFSSLNISQYPFALNSESNHRNCRYLYNRESLKTCIVPQIFKNQKPISRAKTLLQERKKIALLYGQLAKKDINNISRKALIAGFFEDNMFTLLESRVDVCVFRAGFSKTIAAARQLIRNGSVLVNGKKISSCKSRALPGDFFTFTNYSGTLNCYKYTSTSLYNLYPSNVLTSYKIAYFRKKHQQCKGSKKTVQEDFESLLFKKYFQHHCYWEQSFCHCLYWSFLIYKLYKMEPFVVSNNVNRMSLFWKPLWKRSQVHNRPGLSSLFFAEMKKVTANYSKALKDQESNTKAEGSLHFDKNKGNVPYPKSVALDASKEIVLNGHFFQGKGAPLPLWNMEHGQEHEHKGRRMKSDVFLDVNLCFPNGSTLKKKYVVFFNLYTQCMLKKLKVLKIKSIEPSRECSIFRKNISSNDLWAVWGQKPLHLEISQKMGAFIYMYKPQKIISPVCLDWV